MIENEVYRKLEEAETLREVRRIIKAYTKQLTTYTTDDFLAGLILTVNFKHPLRVLVKWYPRYTETCKYYLNKKLVKRCLIQACCDNRYEIVKLLLENGANPNAGKDYIRPLFVTKNFHIAQLLVKAGADVRMNNDFALDYFVCQNCIEIVKLLLENGANVHVDDDMPLQNACIKGYFSIAKLLLEYGANVRAVEDDFLCGIADNGYIEIVRILLEHGINPNLYGKDEEDNNQSMLLMACWRGYAEIAKLLLEYGAEVQIINSYRNEQPLEVASKEGFTEIVKLLLENGADVHTNNDEALVQAAVKGHAEVVELLLKYGANNARALTKKLDEKIRILLLPKEEEKNDENHFSFIVKLDANNYRKIRDNALGYPVL